MIIDFITEMQAYIAAGVEMEFGTVTDEDGTVTRVMRTKNPCAVAEVNGRITVTELVNEEWKER